jgi:hypothetical protein
MQPQRGPEARGKRGKETNKKAERKGQSAERERKLRYALCAMLPKPALRREARGKRKLKTKRLMGPNLKKQRS